MSKPWDHLRKPVKTPIEPGEWSTTEHLALIKVHLLDSEFVRMSIGGHHGAQSFAKDDLNELIEFLTELRDQIQ